MWWINMADGLLSLIANGSNALFLGNVTICHFTSTVVKWYCDFTSFYPHCASLQCFKRILFKFDSPAGQKPAIEDVEWRLLTCNLELLYQAQNLTFYCLILPSRIIDNRNTRNFENFGFKGLKKLSFVFAKTFFEVEEDSWSSLLCSHYL